MAPLLATDWTSPDWSTVGIVVVSVWATACVISSIIVLVVMCACGGKKKKQEEMPPTDGYPKAPEPAPLAEPVAEQQQTVPPPEGVEPAANTDPSYESTGSDGWRAHRADELELMSRTEDPKAVNASSSIGVGGRRAGGQSVMNQPSLVLMDGKSVLHPVKTTAAAPTPVVKASSGHSISWVNPSPQSASSVQGPHSMPVDPSSTSKSVTPIQGSSKTKSVHP